MSTNLHIQTGELSSQVAWRLRSWEEVDRARQMKGMRDVDSLTDHHVRSVINMQLKYLCVNN